MNKIYRVVWNATLGLWQCVSELATAKGKRKSLAGIEAHTEEAKKSIRWFVLTPLVACLALVSGQASAVDTYETISGTKTMTANPIKVGDPVYPNDGAVHYTITSTGVLNATGRNLQITAYAGGVTSSPSDAVVQAVAGSSILVDGGKLQHTGGGWLEIGRTNYGWLTVQNGGTVTTNGTVGIGAWASTTGTDSFVTVTGSGSTLTATQAIAVGDSGNGFNGAGVLNITNGGKVTTGEIYTDNANTYGEVNIDGGTLDITKAGSVFKNFNTLTGTKPDIINIGAGGTTLITSASGDYTQSATAAISGTGALTKEGVGNLILAADNTYVGDTTVKAGTLQLGNGEATGDVASANIILETNTTNLKLSWSSRLP
ncbi:ESPR-type extended signal peptide-containing protein [Pelistega europaea]|uniref:ESPR domain-containing protein n=1 Tax=Pelistega europaea TaxID=106147 RepID=A0A7Y4P540_9BURK|nr:ESPR-type extended signal peptide-containing protein [Pelistega europaea]NOL50146.1 hypothetical protein [Pelistega europaea]